MIFRLARLLFLFSLLPAAAAAATAGDLDLLVRHEVVSVGTDGVTRQARFSERVHRRQDLVWVERVLPEAARHPADAHPAEAHDHPDLAAAPRWLTRSDHGAMRVRLVDRPGRALIDVPPAEYENIGFDGKWDNAYHLLDPRRLAAMRPTTRQAPPGCRWYEAESGDSRLRVLWDEGRAFPRRVESSNRAGTAVKTMEASIVPAPATPPWERLAGYRGKEYSDYLD